MKEYNLAELALMNLQISLENRALLAIIAKKDLSDEIFDKLYKEELSKVSLSLKNVIPSEE